MRFFGKYRRNCIYKWCILILILVTLALVHVYLIPSFTESYNKNCYLDQTSLKNLQFLLTNIIEVFEQSEVVYWLDYGTLLGAELYNSIIPWDYDGDISFIRDDLNIFYALSELGRRGVNANTMIATYGGASVDFMRWYAGDGRYKGHKQTMMYKHYPSWVQDNIIVKIHHKLDAFPQAWIGKRLQVPFLSTNASVPEYYQDLLNFRYKWSRHFPVPYKWKCYVPCFLFNNDPSCKTS